MMDVLIALFVFSFVSSVTPGPNNMMLLASGLNFGYRRTLPHMLGIAVGFTLMVMLIGLGLGQVFVRYPALYMALKIGGALYLIWLALKIARSGPLESDAPNPAARPMTFLQAAAFQWVNPKAWMMAVTAVATYVVVDNPTVNAMIVATVFGVINLPCVSVWALFGVGMRRLLGDPKMQRLFNWTMAGLLVASLYPLVPEVLGWIG
jgi:threonine/homoserine/homoserine lactone efflux protein